MPTYEMPVLLRAMSKPETAAALKRVSNCIFDRGGYIRKIDNLGQQAPPFKMVFNQVRQSLVGFFIFQFDVSPRKLVDLRSEYIRDRDILRTKVFKLNDENAPSEPCTWHEEMLPVPYRPEVQKLMDIASKTKIGHTVEFKHNTGLDYYPFQR